MARTSQFIHPQREPAPLLKAATVLLLRDGPTGLEVLMTRRSTTASFAPGAYVFPGGGIDETDAQSHALAKRRSTQTDTALAQAIAAIRESFEEVGILLATHADGRPADANDISQMDRHTSLFDQCKSMKLHLRADQVFVWAHWQTDRDMPKRFDVPFLAARVPSNQTPIADEKEQFAPEWIKPADALKRHHDGDFFMIFPTIRTLERMKAYATVDDVIHACASEHPLFTSCPRASINTKGLPFRHMESDLAFGELALVCPDGQILHDLTWQHEKPVALLKNLQRLTAPNPSMMTGPGTNTYIIGTVASGYIVIDPGPHAPQHVQRLIDVTQGNISYIICTHSHADHSPGAILLKELFKSNAPPLLGLPSAPTANVNSFFVPDRALANDETVSVTDGHTTHTLRVIYTPGHAANHVCLIMEEDGILISGDHVLNGSTTVINPPDGHMGDYMRSLDQLIEACKKYHVQFILPAHGHVMGNWGDGAFNAIEHIQKLKEHRLKREAKIKRVMDSMPGASIEEWLKHAYDDVHPNVMGYAMRSLMAHVEHLEGR